MAFIEPMHRNKPNITYLLTCKLHRDQPVKLATKIATQHIHLQDSAGDFGSVMGRFTQYRFIQ